MSAASRAPNAAGAAAGKARRRRVPRAQKAHNKEQYEHRTLHRAVGPYAVRMPEGTLEGAVPTSPSYEVVPSHHVVPWSGLLAIMGPYLGEGWCGGIFCDSSQHSGNCPFHCAASRALYEGEPYDLGRLTEFNGAAPLADPKAEGFRVSKDEAKAAIAAAAAGAAPAEPVRRSDLFVDTAAVEEHFAHLRRKKQRRQAVSAAMKEALARFREEHASDSGDVTDDTPPDSPLRVVTPPPPPPSPPPTP